MYDIADIVASLLQGSHASWKVLDFFLKIPGPGKSWKNILEITHFFIGSNGKPAEISSSNF